MLIGTVVITEAGEQRYSLVALPGQLPQRTGITAGTAPDQHMGFLGPSLLTAPSFKNEQEKSLNSISCDYLSSCPAFIPLTQEQPLL